MEMTKSFSNLKSDISDFKSTVESISRQIRGWASSLQNGDSQGQRHLNDRTKQRYDRKQAASEFEKQRAEWKANFEQKLLAQPRTKAESTNPQPDDPS
jgi:hypothetical protein